MANHLTLEERDRIAQLRHQGADQKEIAQAVGRCPSTISRELRRNRTDDEYHAAQAQREAERRRRERPLVRKMEKPEINEAVRAGLAHEWAPEQIAGRMRQQGSDRRVSSQTIYAWIKQDEDREHWEAMLRRRGKRPNRRKNATTGDAARIDQRPEVIEERLRLGDFEGDTVLGPPFTDYAKRIVYRSQDVTKLLANGENVIGAVLGNGFFSAPNRGCAERYSGTRGPENVACLCAVGKYNFAGA